MKMLLPTLLLLASFSCISMAQTSRKDANEQEKEMQYKEIIALVESQKFEFIGQHAITQRGRRVNLTTRQNFVRINGAQAIGDMPYFGVSNSGGYSTSDGGVKFEGQMEDLDIKRNDKKQRITIKFKVKGEGDTYNCSFTINSKEMTSLSVNSNIKRGINYNGIIQVLPKE